MTIAGLKLAAWQILVLARSLADAPRAVGLCLPRRTGKGFVVERLGVGDWPRTDGPK